ncbi:MAG: phosphopantetheine-binding protein [Nitrococcus sp.]|nr:phosphopantetheine-binding protein [Nitrococcus sp.]
MNTAHNRELNLELKQLIVEVTDKDIKPEQIGDEEPLFGRRSTLGLDSLDGLQISMAIQSRYGVVITDPKQLRRLLASVNTLAEYLQEARQSP